MLTTRNTELTPAALWLGYHFTTGIRNVIFFFFSNTLSKQRDEFELITSFNFGTRIAYIDCYVILVGFSLWIAKFTASLGFGFLFSIGYLDSILLPVSDTWNEDAKVNSLPIHSCNIMWKVKNVWWFWDTGTLHPQFMRVSHFPCSDVNVSHQNKAKSSD